jgi:metallophosphoesterase (TIGR00282 family)
MTDELRVLVVGDAVGRPGREAVSKVVPEFKKSGRAHFVIANGENSAHGKGITADTATELLKAGVDVITCGNHTWDNKDVFKVMGVEPRLIRPANFTVSSDVPGNGHGIYEVESLPHVKVGVMNLLGRVHMSPAECPFNTSLSILEQIHEHTPIAILDFHAEATSEKIAMGWFLDGKASFVFGTHTHVATADERLLHKGTAYITDIGMTGGHDGVIGVKVPEVLHRFCTSLPVKHEVADQNVKLSGALVTIDCSTGKALHIERVSVST